MRRIDDNTFEIRTYDNGVLHFVIGRTYKAIGTCGMAKDLEAVSYTHLTLPTILRV